MLTRFKYFSGAGAGAEEEASRVEVEAWDERGSVEERGTGSCQMQRPVDFPSWARINGRCPPGRQGSRAAGESIRGGVPWAGRSSDLNRPLGACGEHEV